jgi:hypothetical protein
MGQLKLQQICFFEDPGNYGECGKSGGSLRSPIPPGTMRSKHVFRSSVLQTGLISLKSHWDWFITKSAEFVKFAAVQTRSRRIDAAMQTKLEGLGENRSIEGQVQILCDVAQIKIDFPRADRDAVRELRLVRNLGLHNRWEVNDRYMRDSANSSLWELGDLRTLSIDEVENWAGVITKLTTNIGIELAVKFHKAPPYPR